MGVSKMEKTKENEGTLEHYLEMSDEEFEAEMDKFEASLKEGENEES